MEAQVQTQASPCGICGGQSGTKTSYSPVTSFSHFQYNCTYHPYSFIHLPFETTKPSWLRASLNNIFKKDWLWAWPVHNLIAALLLVVMEPCHCLATQDLRHFEKASQMNTLTPCDHHLLLHHTAVTHTHCAIGHILQQPANTVVTETQQKSLDAGILCLHNDFNFNLCI